MYTTYYVYICKYIFFLAIMGKSQRREWSGKCHQFYFVIHWIKQFSTVQTEENFAMT